VRDRHPRQRGHGGWGLLDFGGFDGVTATV
jgi:hypothetical protein